MPRLERAQIVAKVREFVGTPHVHQGRRKGIGVDCVGLLTTTAAELDVSTYDRYDYEPLADMSHLVGLLDEHAIRIAIADIQPADIVVLDIEGQPHLAIIGDYPFGGMTMIHALVARGKVVEHRLDSVWRSKIIGAWAWPDVVA